MNGTNGTAVEHGGGIAGAARRYGGAPADWLDLSTGINPVAVELPELAASVWARLPDGNLFDAARVAARDCYGTADGVLPLPVPGTQALIQRLPDLIGAEACAAIVSPTYGEYALVLKHAGMAVDEIAGLDAVTERHRLVVVANPNNPDGRHTPRADLLALADRLGRRGGLLVVDEAFADADPAESVSAEAGVRPGLAVFRSFGKFFGLAGLRLGFLIADPAMTARIRGTLGPWAVSGPALAIAASVMGDRATLAGLRRAIAERHAAMRAVLEGAGLTISGGTPLFFLVEHGRAAALHAHLCRHRILVRAFSYAPGWLRFGLAPDRVADARLAAALAGWADGV